MDALWIFACGFVCALVLVVWAGGQVGPKF